MKSKEGIKEIVCQEARLCLLSYLEEDTTRICEH